MLEHLVSLLELYHMVPSNDDTFISERWMRTCGEWVMLPTGRWDTFDSCKKTKKWSRLNYLDVPNVRFFLDLERDEENQIDSRAGRVEGLSSVLSHLKTLSGPMSSLGGLLSLIQDSALHLHLEGDGLTYLPSFYGGWGRTPVGVHSRSIVNFYNSYRSGKYSTVVGQLFWELANRDGPLVTAFSKLSFTDRWERHGLGYKIFQKQLPLEIEDACIFRVNPNSQLDHAIFGRLRAHPDVLTEAQILTRINLSETHQFILGGRSVEQMDEFCLSMIGRYIQSFDLDILHPISEEIIQHVYNVMSTDPYIYKSLRAYTLYETNRVNEIYPDIDLTRLDFGWYDHPDPARRSRRVAMLQELLEGALGIRPLARHLIEDDHVILRDVEDLKESDVALLITGDRALARAVATKHKRVLMVDFNTWIHGFLDLQSNPWFRNRGDVVEFLDYGHLEYIEEAMYVDGQLVNWRPEQVPFSASPQNCENVQREPLTESDFRRRVPNFDRLIIRWES
jgi:hypothetical protein